METPLEPETNSVSVEPEINNPKDNDRRRFLKQTGLAGGALLGSKLLPQSTFAADNNLARDTYGGDPSLSFDATGFFRLEKTNRWWLVTPEGNAFLSLAKFGFPTDTIGVCTSSTPL